jgi:prepilin-type N-terminal cleavage/methylation domain-containing protein
MKYYSEKNLLGIAGRRSGFTLPEVVAALMILAFVSSNVLVIVDRCMASAAELTLRMQAFEVARDNMEMLLASSSVEEMVDYGDSEKYPEIQWETVVETFNGPEEDRMWVRAVCTAEYFDTRGEIQKIELIHWLTYLTEEQMEKIRQAREEEERLLEEEGQIILTIEEAAEYAGVDVETIRRWVSSGMPITESGWYIKPELDRYASTGGTGRVQPDDYGEVPDDYSVTPDDSDVTEPPEVELPNAEDF